MSELGDQYAEHKKNKAATKAAYREESAQRLTDAGIQYTTNNDGVHLMVEGAIGRVDFWPGTGRWQGCNGKKGFGIAGLITHIKAGDI